MFHHPAWAVTAHRLPLLKELSQWKIFTDKNCRPAEYSPFPILPADFITYFDSFIFTLEGCQRELGPRGAAAQLQLRSAAEQGRPLPTLGALQDRQGQEDHLQAQHQCESSDSKRFNMCYSLSAIMFISKCARIVGKWYVRVDQTCFST